MIFLNSASSAAALVFYLPFSGPSMKSGVHTEERPESGIYFKIIEKIQYLMNTLYVKHYLVKVKVLRLKMRMQFPFVTVFLP